MEAKQVSSSTNHPSIMDRLLPALAPMLLISIGYVDPGKWAATIDGGARFGLELVLVMIVFNCAAILCQYLSALIGVVTRRNLAEICSDEYDKGICVLLGVQTELSAFALDLTMVLGIAHVLSLLLGVNLLVCIFFTAADAVIIPICAKRLEIYKEKSLCIGLAAFVMIIYVHGVLFRQPETPLSMSGTWIKFSGESTFAMMSLLGANILPHNFYLHSSLVQQYEEPPNVSKDALCHDHFFAILSVLSGVSLTTLVLMNSAATEFYSAGLVVLNLQDAMALVDQMLGNSIALFVLLFVLVMSSQITSMAWKHSGSAVLCGYPGADLPGWVHRATVRICTITVSLYTAWNFGAEGLYQLLILTQVMVVLLLPSSLIPLFRVATSRSIMGVYKISQILEFFALAVFLGTLGLNIMFVVEMTFGSSEWVGSLSGNMGTGSYVPFAVLLTSAIASLSFTVWLAITPLKSASAQLDAQAWIWDVQSCETESSEVTARDCRNIAYSPEESIPKHSVPTSVNDSINNFDIVLPDSIDPDPEPPLSSIEEDIADFTFVSPSDCNRDESSSSTIESSPVSVFGNEVSNAELLDPSKAAETEIIGSLEKAEKVEAESQNEKDADEGETWDSEEILKVASGSSHVFPSDGPGSFKSLSLKNDEGGGSGTGSLSRLAGLGRAARRQFAAILDEFWGQLYDLHGQVTQEAKAKIPSLKADTAGNDFSRHYSNRYDSAKQPMVQSNGTMESAYHGDQRGSSSSLWFNHTQFPDNYLQSYGGRNNSLEIAERRYASLRVPPSSNGWDNPPMTVHGYQISSYSNRTTTARLDNYMNGQAEVAPPKSLSSIPTSYRDPKPKSALSSMPAPGFPNPPMSRNSSLQTERSYYDMFSSRPGKDLASPTNTKKYYSLPDISGIANSYRAADVGAERSVQQNKTVGYGSLTSRTLYDQSLYSNNIGLGPGAPLSLDELSPSKAYRDAFSLQSNAPPVRSMWSRQPHEQFGVAGKPRDHGNEGNETGPNSTSLELISAVDAEVKHLKALRHCVLRLLKLEGSDWLFSQNDGADEDLIDRVAARERFVYEAETREMNREGQSGEPQHSFPGKKYSTPRSDDAGVAKSLVSSVPHCGEGCVWRADLITSFGVWSMHRILDLSLMESRPELWGKYTYVLNRLQGIIDLAFTKPRAPPPPCFCLQIPATHPQKSSPPVTNGMLPPASKPGKGKCTTAATLLDTVKDVEIAISCRKGRTGTAAGDVAFPKGKENLASVLKRYKRRLSSKVAGSNEHASGSRKALL